jgi:hypothetical protein
MTRGRKPIVLVNDLRAKIGEEWWGREDYDMWPLWLDDIVSGVARLDWYGNKQTQIPLSTTNIIRCFLHLPNISTETVMELLEIQKSQAKLYVKACCLCYPWLKRSMENEDILRTKYPRQSIVSEEQGLKYGYDKANRALI